MRTTAAVTLATALSLCFVPALAAQALPPAADTAPAASEVDPVQAAAEKARYAAESLESLEAYAGASAKCSAALRAAYGLAAGGKWKSAYDGLVAFDAAGADPYALAMRLDLVLSGALRTENHVSFALKDLEAAEQIDALRETEGDYEMFAFDPAALAGALAAVQAKAGAAVPAVLSKLLGDYYYEALSFFQGSWTMPDEEAASKCIESYAAAVAAGRKDSLTLGRQVELLAQAGRMAEAEAPLRALIAIEPAQAQLRLNLAQLLLQLERSAEGMKALDEAIAAFAEGSSERLQAIALAARSSARLGDLDAYERYMADIAAAMPGNPSPSLLRHLISVERGWDQAARDAADGLMKDYGSEPQVIGTIVSSWYEARRVDEAAAFLARNVASAKDEAAKGALQFYQALLLAQDAATDQDRAAAIAAFDLAEATLKKLDEPENEMLAAIPQIRASLAAGPEEAPADAPVDATTAASESSEESAPAAP